MSTGKPVIVVKYGNYSDRENTGCYGNTGLGMEEEVREGFLGEATPQQRYEG